jgi:hypothetical protein
MPEYAGSEGYGFGASVNEAFVACPVGAQSQMLVARGVSHKTTGFPDSWPCRVSRCCESMDFMGRSPSAPFLICCPWSAPRK